MPRAFPLLVIFLACGVAGSSALAADLAYPVYPLSQPPALDGRWGGAAWAGVPAAVGFTSIKTGEVVSTRPTAFKLGWQGDSLYLAVRCAEPEPDKIKVDASGYRDGWAPDDNLEFFFGADQKAEPKQFVTNSQGARWSNFAPPAGAAPWVAAAARGSDHWSVEVRIPFALLGLTGPPQGGRFWFNLGRAAYGNPELEQFSSFAPVTAMFAQVGRFAELAFRDTPPTAEVLAQTQKDLDRLTKSLRERLWKAANVKEAFLADRQGDEALTVFLGLKRQAGQLLAAGDFAAAPALLARCDALKTELSVPSRKLVFELKTRNAKAPTLWLNGAAVTPQAGKWPLRLVEGVNVIALATAGDGPNPGLRLSVAGQPDLQRRWRVGPAAGDDWKTTAFDDRAWVQAAADKEGFLSLPPSDGAVCLRQLVLWSANHYSALPCLEPKVREWGFSEGSLETLFHTLYTPPPLTTPLSDYQFVLDVPRGFTLIQERYADGDKGGKLTRGPQAVVVEQTTHDNQPYTRYRFSYEPEFVQSDKVQCALIPLVMDGYRGVGKLCKFYYRRLASGNLTEIEQVLPVRILPPLNGRLPKQIMISQYCAEPWVRTYCGKLFPQHFEAFMRQALSVGFSHWILPPSGDAYTRQVHDRVMAGGGTVVIWGPNNYPLYGNTVRDGALGKLLETTPDLHVRYYGATTRSPAQFCRSYATGPGAAQFQAALKQDIGAMLHGSEAHKFVGLPHPTIYWNDWEQTPWLDHNFTPGFVPGSQLSKTFCFCDLCKQTFRQWAKLPADADLSDEAIRKNHYKEWSRFREDLDGRVNGIIKAACNELGMQYMYYNCAATNGTWFAGNWELNRGRIDLAFPGWPGDGQAVGYGPHDGVGSFPVDQSALDREMTFMREKVGLERVTGQLFASSVYGMTKPLRPWPQTAIVGRDGFLNAARLKPSILRIVASFHGGVDLDTAVERCAGQFYYLGEATRALSDFEDLFYSGRRQDDLAVSAQVKYPNLLVLTKGEERLVLVFNEGAKPLAVELANRDTRPGQTATIWGQPGKGSAPAQLKLTVPPDDVALVHIK